MTKRLAVAVMAALLAVLVSCADDSKETGDPGDGGTDTGAEDTDSWVDAYSMPFDVEPFQWANVPGGLEAPTAETFASRVLVILFFQKW